MTKRITSLPDRPLRPSEADQLVDTEKFVPLTVVSKSVDEIADNKVTQQETDGSSVMLVYSLLHATEEKGYTIAYSEDHGYWVKVLEKTAEDYNSTEIEQETHEFVKEHSDVDVDAGFADISDV